MEAGSGEPGPALLQQVVDKPWQPLQLILLACHHVTGCAAAALFDDHPPGMLLASAPGEGVRWPPQLAAQLCRVDATADGAAIVAGAIDGDAGQSFVALRLTLPRGEQLGLLCLLFAGRRLPDSRLCALLRGMGAALQAELQLQLSRLPATTS
ncbi:MAG TPA: hypothetical protein VLI06_18440 [Solimonas sp.]|nr:hypothetical protein [Solimonas sp.]